MRKRYFFVNFIRGIVLGISVLIPGLSGGTMALILGMYDDLLYAVGNLVVRFKKSMNFLLPVALGGILGFVLFSKIILFVLDNFFSYSVFFFSGIIFGSIPKLFRSITSKGKRRDFVIYIILGIVFSVLFSFMPNRSHLMLEGSVVAKLLLFLIYGALLAFALILPGVSFSLVLLLSGLYYPFLDAVQNLNLYFLLPFISCIGLFTILFSTFLSNMFKKYPEKMSATIIGFVIMSGCQMLMDKDVVWGLYQGVWFAIGLLLSLILQKNRARN